MKYERELNQEIKEFLQEYVCSDCRDEAENALRDILEMDREKYLIKQIASLKEVALNAILLKEEYEKELENIRNGIDSLPSSNDVPLTEEEQKCFNELILLEKLAEIEHEQWVEWSKALSQSEKLSLNRLERWKRLWIPYAELTEDQKEQDRIYARKILKILGGNGITPTSKEVGILPKII